MKTMRRTFAVLVLAGAFACSISAQPVVTMVLNRASNGATVSPGCWVMILGYNFAPSPINAQAGSLPTTLGAVSVTVGGLPAPLLYVSPTEVDALIPAQTTIPQNTVVPVAVTSGAGSGTYNIRLTRNAPAIYTRNDGSGLAVVFDPNFRQVDTIGPQDILILYATGLGPTDSSGRVVDNVEVYIGDRRAQVLFAGLAPGLPGIYQLKHPDLFSALGIFHNALPALTSQTCAALQDVAGLNQAFRAIVLAGATDDSLVAFPTVEAAHNRLSALGIAHTYRVVSGDHSWHNFRNHFADFVGRL